MDRTVTKTYGRGSLLGFISPLVAFLMASLGMNGWERRAKRDMEADVLAMQRKGYRVVSADEYRWPIFGIAWFKVTYQPLAQPPS